MTIRFIPLILISLAMVLSFVAAAEYAEYQRDTSRVYGAAAALALACIAGYYAGVIGGAW